MYTTVQLQKKGFHRYCEDRMMTVRNNDRILLLVADGHGHECYVRSKYGARFACYAAKKVLFNNSLDEATAKEKAEKIKNFYDKTVALHLARHPLTELENERADGIDPTLTYGTTLIAALITPEYTDVYKVGDGEVHIIDGDGILLEPLRADDICIGTQTSSLAQSKDKVMRSFRTARYTNVAACIMFTDGCEGGLTGAIQALAHDSEDTVTDKLMIMLDKTDHGDDQTVLIAYKNDKTTDEAFCNGIYGTVSALKKKRRAEAMKKQNLEEYKQLREYLRKALKKASELQQKNDPEFQELMRKILIEHERMEYLRSKLNIQNKTT